MPEVSSVDGSLPASPPKASASAFLTLGGLAAAFGVAACCALPLLLTQPGARHRLAGGDRVGRRADPAPASNVCCAGSRRRGYPLMAAAASRGDMRVKWRVHTTVSANPDARRLDPRRCAADYGLSLCLTRRQSSNQRSPVRSADNRRLKPCRPTPAGSFTTAPAAASCLDRSRASAASSVPTAACPVRRSRATLRARLAADSRIAWRLT